MGECTFKPTISPLNLKKKSIAAENKINIPPKSDSYITKRNNLSFSNEKLRKFFKI